jgi:chemotaxis protein CheC
MSAQPLFSDYNLDVITEIINIGIGRAANALGTLMQQRVLITITATHIIEEPDLNSFIRNHFRGLGNGLRLQFHGKLNGNAYLIIGKQETLQLLSQLPNVSRELIQLGIVEMDTFAEIGNILLSSSVGTIGEQLGLRLRFHPPQVLMNISGEEIARFILNKSEPDEQYLGLFFTSRLQARMVTVEIPIGIIFRLTRESVEIILQALHII